MVTHPVQGFIIFNMLSHLSSFGPYNSPKRQLHLTEEEIQANYLCKVLQQVSGKVSCKPGSGFQL